MKAFSFSFAKMSIVAGIEEDSPYDRFYPITRAMANAIYAAQAEVQDSDDQALAAQPSATADGMKLVDGLFAAVDAEHQQFVSSVAGRVDRLGEGQLARFFYPHPGVVPSFFLM